MTDFARALKKPTEKPPAGERPARTSRSRRGAKHIGGYFPLEVSKQLRMIAALEDTSNQNLLAEALDMLFQSRRMPTIATAKAAKTKPR